MVFKNISGFYISATFSLIWIITQCLSEAQSLSCYECSNVDNSNSSNEEHCPQFMTKSDELIIPQRVCSNVSESDGPYYGPYCVIATGVVRGLLGTRRFCSPRDEGTYCEFIRLPDEDEEYESCILTCSSNGCNTNYSTVSNHARTLAPNLCISILSAILSVFVLTPKILF